MGPTARMLWLALGILLAMIAVTMNPASVAQESFANVSPQDQQTAAPDKKPGDKVEPGEATDTVQPAQATGTGQPGTIKGSGQDQKVEAAGNDDSARNPKKAVTEGKSKPQTKQAQSTTRDSRPSPIHQAGVEIMDSLDVALTISQKLGVLSPNSPAGKQANDLSARRNNLQQKVRAAKDDKAWAEVASGAAAILVDTLKLVGTNSPSLGVGSEPADVQAATKQEPVPKAAEYGLFFMSPQLPLYIAGLSLVVSALGLGGGWLLARREIKKALIEAGLL
jgi:hypothetical protein